MRAVLCREWGKPGSLVVGETPEPALEEGGVRIAVKAAGVNFGDILMVAGTYQTKPDFPFSPGLEVAGEVLECAAGVNRVRPGDRVMAMVGHGGFAEQVVAPAQAVYEMPRSMDFVTAAAFPVAYGTSHLGLREKVRLQAGETVLVHGAAGGVGLTAVEIAKQLGATVIATAGGAEKLAVAAEYGADHLIDYRNEDIRERVKALTGGRGADVVYDPVGGSAFDASLRCVVPGGRLLIVGFASGTVPQIPANLLLVKNLTVIGYYWGAHRTLAPDLIEGSFAELFDWYAEGRLKPRVSHTFDLADAGLALETLRTRRSTGKVVLTTGG
jgi:NADPH2:quinone reductase